MAKAAGSSKRKKLVVVESPTKARTISRFLDSSYIVESCMGHVRDLPQSAKDIPESLKKEKWAKLGVNIENDFEPLYCIPKNKQKVVKDLRAKLKDADELILATDEDREGESISWHLMEVLKPKVPVKRMVFHEITKNAIQQALEEFRDIDYNLVKAQEARRILDRLVGYTISPLIWKKIAYGLSAGRVQSVAVRLICEKELERLRFHKAGYWGVTASCQKNSQNFETRLFVTDGKRIASGKDFDPETGALLASKKADTLHLLEDRARKIAKEVPNLDWKVTEVEEKPVSRKPAPPFITSTLQQEANRKLGMSARETMQVAQSLYERGLITYMRTDSTFLSDQALQAARKRIQQRYGKEYLPDTPRTYMAKKVKGAQEAHEAIRPAGTEMLPPEDAKLKGPAYKLYELIWKRTIASQMVNSQQKQVSVRFQAGDHLFSASGMTIEFPGFLKAYVESLDNVDDEDREVRLPAFKKGDVVQCRQADATEHETKPPARYTEASLVQTLEKEGVGRPSTYASIIGTIQDRGYVNKIGNALVPTFTAMIVSKLLSKHFPRIVDTEFTSHMERQLDEIAEGELESIKYLSEFYLGKDGLLTEVEVKEKQINEEEARSIQLPQKQLKDLSFRVGRYGAYVCRQEGKDEVCASLPESQAPADITSEIANKLIDQKINGTDALGEDPETGEPIYVLTGRYGPYVQLGDASAENAKPKRTSLPQGLQPEDVDIEKALFLLSMPRTLGMHPELKKEIKLGIGRFGPYVVCEGDFRSVPRSENLFEVSLKRALELFAQPKKGRGRAAPLKELGNHPETGDPIQVLSGRYGPYIKCGKTNVSLPDEVEPQDVTVEKALELLADKIGSTKGAKGAKTAKKAKKTVSKKKASPTGKVIAKGSTSAKAPAKKTITRKKSLGMATTKGEARSKSQKMASQG